MSDFDPAIFKAVAKELEIIWKAHRRVGLEGYMCLYSLPDQEPWRSKEPGLAYWFNEQEIPKAIEHLKQHYNEGKLPNTPLQLLPVVHKKLPDGNYEPLGSGITWAIAFCLGIDALKPDQPERIRDLGIFTSTFQRGGNNQAGLKMIGFLDKAEPPLSDDIITPSGKALYEIANIKSEPYYAYYPLSGLSYLSKHGSFIHPSFAEIFGETLPDENFMKEHQVAAKKLLDAETCWEAYDRHHSLFVKFGINTANIEQNLRLYNLCARDIQLFDSTGPMRVGAGETFDFIVPGYIPRGSITLLAGSGGTGKSSAAHHLCVLAAIDYKEGEEKPKWLGQPLNTEYCNGVSIYFSGEDGPAIINARGALYDPEGRATRLMFQRNNFGEGVTLDMFLRRLQKMPDVPLMVIDPARKYLAGDENDSDVVSHFFEAIEEFAVTKNTAIVVVHHLEKGANPKSARQVLDCLRGSQVFIDRPRVVIGMYRDGPNTIVGLAKNNIPPNLGMVLEERVFVRDPKSLQLLWLPGPEGIRSDYLPPKEVAKIRANADSHEHDHDGEE
jgi:hypothetical protein